MDTHIVEFELGLDLILLVVSGQLIQHSPATSSAVVGGRSLRVQVPVGVWNTIHTLEPPGTWL